ncbi:MAG: glycosyltransferase [Flavobacteriales bacterium]|nr:glycosyltransferase [Flavobacteriales bacterium]
MIFFVTYNDQPSGVYWSQVTDVVGHLNELGNERVRLVALISLRGYSASRRRIRSRDASAIVLPIIPRAHNWRINWVWLYVLCVLYKPTGIIGRGIFASALALRMRRRRLVEKVVFDARAAYGAEWREFRVVDDDRLIAECAELEREVVASADMRMSVSAALVDHWKQQLGYRGHHQVVIPCTLGNDLQRSPSADELALRSELGWAVDALVLVYSGSTVGWQSLDLLTRMLLDAMRSDARIHVLFLSEADPHINALKEKFPGRVARRWVHHEHILDTLSACDIGLLVRERTVTNQVASPTKFAEYLSAGLSVLISEDLGDLGPLVRSEQVGWVLADRSFAELRRPTMTERERSKRVAQTYFTKRAYEVEYGRVLRCLGTSRVEGDLLPDGAEQRTYGLVSVVVPSYNKGRYLREMVASVQRQSHAEWEMLFVDDASNDGTREVIAELAAADPRIKLHLQEQNAGANHCRNLGVQLARGEHLVFLDADDVLAPHCLLERLNAASLGGLDLVVSTMEVFHQHPGDGENRWVPSARDPLGEFLRHQLPWSVMQPLWRRSFLLELGGFDTDFARHQDVEFHTRALLHPLVRYRTLVGEPDCFYRIAEERKVLRPLALLEGYTASALRYYFKFYDEARRTGRHRLLLGIIYQTLVQLQHNRKLGLITDVEFRRLRAELLDPRIERHMGWWKRLLFEVAQVYNALPVRVPGVNMLLYRSVTL